MDYPIDSICLYWLDQSVLSISAFTGQFSVVRNSEVKYSFKKTILHQADAIISKLKSPKPHDLSIFSSNSKKNGLPCNREIKKMI